MMWVLFALSLLELVVVHIFVALKWPVIGWTFTTISAFAVCWLVWWILSMKRLPHELRDGVLILRLGAMKTVEIALDNVADITSSWEPGAIERRGNINLAAIAHPNRCLELKKPTKKGKERVFIRLDDAGHFDAVLAQHGFNAS